MKCPCSATQVAVKAPRETSRDIPIRMKSAGYEFRAQNASLATGFQLEKWRLRGLAETRGYHSGADFAGAASYLNIEGSPLPVLAPEVLFGSSNLYARRELPAHNKRLVWLELVLYFPTAFYRGHLP